MKLTPSGGDPRLVVGIIEDHQGSDDTILGIPDNSTTLILKVGKIRLRRNTIYKPVDPEETKGIGEVRIMVAKGILTVTTSLSHEGTVPTTSDEEIFTTEVEPENLSSSPRGLLISWKIDTVTECTACAWCACRNGLRCNN